MRTLQRLLTLIEFSDQELTPYPYASFSYMFTKFGDLWSESGEKLDRSFHAHNLSRRFLLKILFFLL